MQRRIPPSYMPFRVCSSTSGLFRLLWNNWSVFIYLDCPRSMYSFNHTETALIIGSFYPCVYYGFFCSPTFQIIYLAGITIAGVGAAAIVLTPRYSKPDYRAARAGVFVSLGLFAVLPVGHA